MRAHLVASIGLLVLATTHPRLMASEPNDAALATELFDAGRALMKEGKFAQACPKLAESAHLDEKVGTFAKLAECEEKVGHLASARAQWQKARNLAAAESDPRLSHVERELARIDALVPKLSITLRGTAPPGLVVRLDDAELGPGSLGVALPVDPGVHTLGAGASHKKTWTTTVETKGNGATVAVSIPALEDQLAPAASSIATSTTPAASPPREAPHGSGQRVLGAVVGGVGVAGLTVSAIFGAVASSSWSQSQRECSSPTSCPNHGPAVTDHDAAARAALVSTLAFAAGGALVASGIVLFLTAPKTTTDSRAGIRLSPAVGPQGGGVSLGGQF